MKCLSCFHPYWFAPVRGCVAASGGTGLLSRRLTFARLGARLCLVAGTGKPWWRVSELRGLVDEVEVEQRHGGHRFHYGHRAWQHAGVVAAPAFRVVSTPSMFTVCCSMSTVATGLKATRK